jgi:hypothetical protein
MPPDRRNRVAVREEGPGKNNPRELPGGNGLVVGHQKHEGVNSVSQKTQEVIMEYDLFQTERAQSEDLGVLKVYRGRDDRHNQPTAMLFLPKAIKPFANYLFSTEQKREEYIMKQVTRLQNHQAWREEQKQARKGTPDQVDSVKIGDIFQFSWGYDQTNVDFYQVVQKHGRILTLREIGQRSTDTETGNSMADYRVPVKDAFVIHKEPLKKLLQFYHGTPYIKMASYGSCHLWNGKECYCSWDS